jgi:hypothetical protein
MKKLTEADAATAYAKAWNRLDPSEFIDLLTSDARYASQWVFEELTSKQAIGDYLTAKMSSIKMNMEKDPEVIVFAELGKTATSLSNRDCVILAQGTRENVKAVVHFGVEDNKIKRYDLSIPELVPINRSGVYPV